MYAHFGHGFVENGRVNSRFAALMERLSRKNGWFVPVGTLLDHLAAQRESAAITDRQRASLERQWLIEKLWRGTC
jgi:hypothetical protein